MTKREYLMPCYVNKNPGAIVWDDEAMIWYPWKDRCEENWSIGLKESVVIGYECLPRGNSLNHLIPSLLQGITKFKGDFAYVWLNDLDSKWVNLERSKLVHLTLQEAKESLRNPDFLKERYSIPLQDSKLKIGRTIHIASGLFVE